MTPRSVLLVLFCVSWAGCGGGREQAPPVRVKRLLDAPIITPSLHPSIGENIQGPSLIRVPDWVESPLGRYYFYFADHKGRYIRLAYADELTGPWKIHEPGSLQIERSYFLVEPPAIPDDAQERATKAVSGSSDERKRLPHSLTKEATTPHIASPDVHVDDENRRIVMYFHGLDGFARQLSRVALSNDGIEFDALPDTLARSYLRVFQYDEITYGIAMPGVLYRARNGLKPFQEGRRLFNPDMRHCAVLRRGDVLYVFWTQVGHAPERILLSTIDLSVPWAHWRESAPVEVMRPERVWEGADQPLEPSMRSVAYGPVNQLRDPAIFEEDGRVFLLYAVAGESGIGIAEIFMPN